MRSDFILLKRVKLLEFLESESEHIVIERLRCPAEQPLEGGFVVGRITGVYGDGAADVSSLRAFEAQLGFSKEQIQPPAVVSTFCRFIPSRAAAFFETEEHR